jgi:hypothetical protein
MTFLDAAIKRVRDDDAGRPRSVQASVGWSEVGGCRAALGYRLDGAWASDETDNWAAVRGTALHSHLEPILSGPGVRTEVGTEYRGIPGHADLVDATSVTDIKTKTLASSKLWAADLSLLRQARVQAHGYCAGLVGSGELPEDATVRILVVPVDGTFADWWCYEEPFDRALADEGADRLEQVQALMDAGQPLPKDKPYAFCQSWCPFFSLCRVQDDPMAMEEITDPEIAAAVRAYGEANRIHAAAAKDKERLAALIRGVRGVTPDGWRISLGKPGEERNVLDEEAVRADYEARGFAVPMTTKPGNAPRLSVTAVKAKAGAK